MTKKDICNIINNSTLKISLKEFNSTSKNITLKIPLYKTKFKKFLVSTLAYLLQKKAYFPNKEPLVSQIDFSKFIYPDDWTTCHIDINNIQLIAIPKYINEHQNCWEINLVAELFKEDLRYGIKPINVYNYFLIAGPGPIIIDKKSNKFYRLGSGHSFYHDVIKEFNKFSNNKTSNIKWEHLEVSIKNI